MSAKILLFPSPSFETMWSNRSRVCESEVLCCRGALRNGLSSALTTLTELLRDGKQFLTTITRSRAALGAEVLFLRKQLAYYQEHQIRPAATDKCCASL